MYRLTDRQSAALANMENYVGIRSPRTDFKDRDAFQAYWELVSRRCDAATRTRAKETPASRQVQRQQKKERATAYYQQLDHVLTYGREYAKRYRPSTLKLRQQLLLKCADAVLADQALRLLAERLHDDSRALEIAERLQHQNRHAQAIRLALRKRLFTPEVIDRCVQILTAQTGSVLDAEALNRKVRQLQRKGLSQRAMRQKLMGSSADGPVVTAALAQTLGEHGDDQALRSAVERLANKHLDRPKLIQRLASKGFRYTDIVRILTQSVG